MRDELRGVARLAVRLLPTDVLERWYLPTWYELLSRHADGEPDRRPRHAVAAAVLLQLRAAVALLDCARLILIDGLRSAALSIRALPSQGVPMLFNDLRFAARVLRKNLGFTAVAVLTLALGVGANTAIFSVVHAVLLRTLPFPQPDRILELNETARGSMLTLSPPNLLDWKAQNTTFSAIAAYSESTTTLSGGSEPEQLDAAEVGAELFAILGVPPMYGRVFNAADEQRGGPRVVMLGYGLWQRRFGGDPSLVGGTLTFDGRPYQVIGIMPRGVTFPGEIDLWFPLRLMPEDISPNQRGAHYLSAVGRLKDGVTATQAIADLARIEAQITAQFSSVEGYGVWAQPLLDSMVGEVRRPLLMLLGAVGFVLLIACVNVSNLLLARASGRRTEIAVRSALGAGRIRIVRQLLAESLLLALVGGLCGIVLAAWGVRALDTLLPQDLPRAAGIAVNLPVLLFSAAVAVLTGLFFGVVPSLQASTSDVSTFLREGRRDGGGSGGSRAFRNVLVATEVALAIVLLTGAGLAARSFDRLTRIDLGFNPQNVLSLTVTPSAPRYAEGAALVDLYRRYVDGMATQPGVKAAGAVMMPPLARGGFGGTFSIIGAPESDDLRMSVRAITHGYLEAAEIPVKRGRSFTAADTETAQPVAIISEEAARRYWPGKDPIGQRIRIHVGLRQGSGREGEREIVGVVGDVKLRQISGPASPAVYVPHSQYVADSMTVFIRTAGDPAAIAQIAKARLAEIDPSIAVTRLGPATQHVSSAVAQPRFRMVLLGAFAVMALVLAVVGLYGVLAYSVTRRQSEIGLRMALGADRSSVLRLILIQGLIPVFAGIVAGLAIAAVLTRTMRTLLYGVEPIDPITYTVVAVGLGVVAAVACYVPARRATRIDPLSALRTE